jgi:hypothetical protein
MKKHKIKHKINMKNTKENMNKQKGGTQLTRHGNHMVVGVPDVVQ